jgi:hypothetical protein
VRPHKERTHCPAGHEYSVENTRRAGPWKTRFCRACDSATQLARAIAHPELQIWDSARSRAKRDNLPFEIKPSDIVVPEVCPVLGLSLRRQKGGLRDASPSLDRLEPSKGYIIGNIAVISYRANRIKNDATLEELDRVAAWLRSTLQRKG